MTQTSLSMRVGKVVRRRRMALGLSATVVAAAAGMSLSSYRALERGEKNISVTTLQRLCAELKLQMWELVREATH